MAGGVAPIASLNAGCGNDIRQRATRRGHAVRHTERAGWNCVGRRRWHWSGSRHCRAECAL